MEWEKKGMRKDLLFGSPYTHSHVLGRQHSHSCFDSLDEIGDQSVSTHEQDVGEHRLPQQFRQTL